MKKLFLLLVNLCFMFNAAFCADNDHFNIDFWKKFNDDILISNLTKVYENNHDLKAAVLKTNEAQRVVKMSFASELPYIGFEGYLGHTFHSSTEVFGDMKIPDYTQSHFLLPLTMDYEIDIWGKNHLKTKSKKKQLEMIKQDEKSAYIYILSIFASDYYNLIRIDKLVEYQKELIELQNQVVNSVEQKYELGTADIDEVENVKKNLTYFEQDLENLKEKQDTLKNQMAALLADRSFQDIKRISFDKIKNDLLTPQKIKFETLDNRPDKIKAELDLERIGIDIKIAKRDLLPKFIITGNMGFNMYNISSSHNFLADLGVVPVFDIFTGGRKLQTLKLKKDDYDIALEHYEKTILKSIQESNDALYSLKTADKLDSITNKRLLTDEKLLSDVELKKDFGVSDNLDLLIQKEVLIETKKLSVNSKINAIIAKINLYQALGGVDFTNQEQNL